MNTQIDEQLFQEWLGSFSNDFAGEAPFSLDKLRTYYTRAWINGRGQHNSGSMLEAWLEVLPIWELKKTIQELCSVQNPSSAIIELIRKVEMKLHQRLQELSQYIEKETLNNE